MSSKLKAVSPEVAEPGHSKLMLVGPSGVGKSWFALSMPTPYYFDTEGGAQLRHYKERLRAVGGRYLGPEHGTLDFEFLFEQMLALATEKHEFKTLVIDSITKLFQTCIAGESERLGSKDVFGASKKPAHANMRRLVALVSRLDMNVLFIAHETTEWGVNPQTKQREEVGKTADVWEKLVYELDLTLFAQKRGGSRVAIVRKSRLLGFPEGKTFPLEYGDFAEGYGKDFIEAAVKPLVLASAEQVAEINRLCAVLKMEEGALEKHLAKASAETVAELGNDHAAKLIDWLKKKVS